MRPFPNALNGENWDLVFSLMPGLTFLFLAAITIYSTARMPKHPYFKAQTIGLGGFGAVLALIGVVLFVPPVRARIQDIFWFSAKVAVSMYMYIWYRGTFPRYPLRSADEGRMEDPVAARHWRANPDGDRRSLVLSKTTWGRRQ